MRKVLGPEIIQQRLNIISENNIWTYINKINKQLNTNNIREDGSIDVTANFIVDPDILEKLESMYIEAGWDRMDISYTDSIDGYSAKTIIRVYPYPSV